MQNLNKKATVISAIVSTIIIVWKCRHPYENRVILFFSCGEAVAVGAKKRYHLSYESNAGTQITGFSCSKQWDKLPNARQTSVTENNIQLPIRSCRHICTKLCFEHIVRQTSLQELLSWFEATDACIYRDLITGELELLQSGQFVDAGERCGRWPDNLLEPRSRSDGEGNLGDGRAVNFKKVEP